VNTANPSHATNETNIGLDDVNLKRVLVPVDFSVCTLQALHYAKVLAEKFRVVIDVLHVIPPGLSRNETTLPNSGASNTIRQELYKLVGILSADGVKVRVQVRAGRAYEVILHEAASARTSLIIIGMRNRSWMSGLCRRHTANRVLKNSPCPVIVLRSELIGRDSSQEIEISPVQGKAAIPKVLS
jgi:nucleotide-binding universal stress UspA family protein